VAAGCLDKAMRAAFPGSLPRGCKPITAKDNGAGFVRLTPCPAVIAEPFFGTNRNDWEEVAGRPETLAAAIAVGLRAAHDIFKKGWKQ
jgi:hypothetical protein